MRFVESLSIPASLASCCRACPPTPVTALGEFCSPAPAHNRPCLEACAIAGRCQKVGFIRWHERACCVLAFGEDDGALDQGKLGSTLPKVGTFQCCTEFCEVVCSASRGCPSAREGLGVPWGMWGAVPCINIGRWRGGQAHPLSPLSPNLGWALLPCNSLYGLRGWVIRMSY